MYKCAFLFLIVFSVVSNIEVRAQDGPNNQIDPFFSITRDKEWTVSKLFITSTQIDKKSYLSSTTFKFNQADTSDILIQVAGRSSSLIGHWTPQDNNKILFSIPLVTNDSTTISAGDSLYNEGVKLLCAWPLQEIEMQQALIKFKITDPMKGEILIEFTRKEL